MSVQIDNKNLSNVDAFEYLGVLIDNKLKMNSQVDKIFKKVSTKLYTFSLIRKYMSLKIALLTYKVMILPHFDYVDFTIDSATNEYTDKLEQLHKCAIRKIEFCIDYRQQTDYNTLLKEYGLTTLYQRRAEHLLFFVYKYKDDIITLDPQLQKIELRSKNKVKLKSDFTTKTKVQNSPLYRGILLWNKLPDKIQLIGTVPEFKSILRKLFDSGELSCRLKGSRK